MSTPSFFMRQLHLGLLLAAIAGPLGFSTAARGQATVTWDGSTDMTWTQPDSTSWSGATYESGNTAVFAGSGTGTVAIDAGGVTPGQTDVTAGSYTFSGGPLGGSGGIAKSGSGTLTLAAANTYSGTTSITGGVLNIQNGAALGSTAAGTTVASGAALQIQGGITVTGESLSLAGSGVGNANGALRNISGSNTWSGTIEIVGEGVIEASGNIAGPTRIHADSGLLTLSGPIEIAAPAGATAASMMLVQGAGNVLISGNISGGKAGTISVASSLSGAGTRTLSGSNSYLGWTAVNGNLSLEGGAAIPDTSRVVSESASGRLVLNGSETIGGLASTGAMQIDLQSHTLTIGADNVTPRSTDFGGASYRGTIIGTGGITKIGAGTLTLAGGDANTYTGTTAVSGGVLSLGKTAGITAVAGDLAITDAAVTFAASNQIAVTAAVTMSGSGSVFNGTSFNIAAAGNVNLDQTINSLMVTGGLFFPGGPGQTDGFTVTGAASFTGGAGETQYIQNSGGLSSFGSLALTGLTSSNFNASQSTPNRFIVQGNQPRQSVVTVGPGGLSLDNSNVLLMQGNVSGNGSRVVLDGDVTTTGSAASAISGESPTKNGVWLSGTAGTVTRTFTIGGGGANLTVGVPITDGSATTAGIRKLGSGTLTLSASNSYTGGTQVDAGVLALGNADALGSAGTISFGGGTLQFSASNTTDYSSRFSTAAAQAYSLDTNSRNVTLASPLTSSGGSLTKLGAGRLTLSGGDANTYSGTTTVLAGELSLNKTAGATAVGGDLVITGAAVTFGADNQIADTATVVVSGGGTLNGTDFNTNARAQVVETIGSLAVNGGNFNGSSSTSAWGWTVTGTGSFTGGEGLNNTRAIFYSGGNNRFGGLSLTNMTGTAGSNSTAANAFTVYGNFSTRSTGLFVGSGGLTLDNSVLNLRRGGTGSQGSRLVLDGDVTVTGAAASRIAEDTAGGTFGIRDVELSSTAGSHVRTFTTGGGGADLSVLVPITNGSATTAGIRKLGAGTLTLGNANTYTGGTTISAGVLALAAGGSFATSPTITVGDTGSSGAVLDLTAKTGTFAFTSSQTVGGIGTIRMDAGDTAQFAGILAPGNSAGILTFDGGTALLSGTTQIEILGATRGTGYDAIDLINSAAINYGNGVLALDFGSWLADPQSYQLFGTGSQSRLGSFSAVTIAGDNYAGLMFTGSSGVWTSQGTIPSGQTLTFTEATGTLVIVPEPGALLVASLGLAAAALLRRSRR